METSCFFPLEKVTKLPDNSIITEFGYGHNVLTLVYFCIRLSVILSKVYILRNIVYMYHDCNLCEVCVYFMNL